jgi:hypothetical protein
MMVSTQGNSTEIRVYAWANEGHPSRTTDCGWEINESPRGRASEPPEKEK